MTTTPAPRRRIAVAAVALVLATLAACTSPDSPGTDDPTDPATSSTGSPSESTEPTPEVEAAEVRATLGAVDPCSLLAPDGDGARARYADGPHTCEGQLDDVRVRVEVGVPFDDASRADSDAGEVAGLAAFTAAEGCRLVFPVGPGHGIAVELDDQCDVLPEAAEIVGTALAAPDVDTRLRSAGPDSHTACGLIAGAVSDPDLLLDAAGDQSQGLDHCVLESGAVLARTGLSIDYNATPFDEVARLLKGERVTLVGQDAVVSDRGSGCSVHTYLWETDAEGRGAVRAEAVVRAADCQEAQDVAEVVIEAAGTEPAAPGDLADLLAGSQG